MQVKVRVNLFSGIPNPEVYLSNDDTWILVNLINNLKLSSRVEIPRNIFGYRGMIIEADSNELLPFDLIVNKGQIRINSTNSIYFDEESKIELFLLEKIKTKLGDDLYFNINAQIQNETIFMQNFLSEKAELLQPVNEPIYNAWYWNDSKCRKKNNNCYNYACNCPYDSYAQPGAVAGYTYDEKDCANIKAAAEIDGLEYIGDIILDEIPLNGYYVALFTRNISGKHDFHWYRRDKDLTWSHKPGEDNVRNTDWGGAPICNPKYSQNRFYNTFCGFFLCIPERLNIDKNPKEKCIDK